MRYMLWYWFEGRSSAMIKNLGRRMMYFNEGQKMKDGWSDENIEYQKRWHDAYNKAWNLFMSTHPQNHD